MARRASQRTHRAGGLCLAVCAVLVAAILRTSDGLAAHAPSKRPATSLSFLELHPALPIPRSAAGDVSVRQAARALPRLRGGDAAVGVETRPRSESPGSPKQKPPPLAPAAPVAAPEAPVAAPAAPVAAPAAAPQQTQAPVKAAPAGGATLADLFSALAGPGPSTANGNGAAAQARTSPPRPRFLQIVAAAGLLIEDLSLRAVTFRGH